MISFRGAVGWAVAVAALAVFIDVAGHVPTFSILLSVSGIIAILWQVSRAKSGEKFRSMFLRLSAAHVLVLAFPICVIAGVVCQSLALIEADRLRQVLLAKSRTEPLDKAYAESCWDSNTRSCGFFTYKVLLADKGIGNPSHLIVMQFFEQRVAVDLVSGGRRTLD